MKAKKQVTIGFIIPNLLGAYFKSQYFSINQFAVENNINLIIFTPYIFVTDLNNKIGLKKIFYFISNARIDGLIVSTAALYSYFSKEEVLDFFYSDKDLPVISIGNPVANEPSVIIDNKMGMYDLINHFIKDHGYKDIVFLKGFANNPEAILRFEAYQEVLANYHIPFRKELVLEGDFGPYSGKQAVCTLLDKKKVKVDAIIAANDDMILGVLTELLSRGIRVPDQIALGGFDNIKASREAEVSISTVSQPLDKQINKAMELILQCIEGHEIPKQSIFPALPVFRESCGCGTGESDFIVSRFQDDDDGYNILHEGWDMGILSQFTTQISNALSYQTIKMEFAKVLPEIDATFCCIALYKNGMPLFVEQDEIPPLFSEVFFVFQDGKVKDFGNDTKFKTKSLFPDMKKKYNRRFTYITSELIFQNEHYGFVTLEIPKVNPFIINLFKIQFANCLHNIYIHQQIENTNKELQKAKLIAESANTLKTRFLANISHEIRTPMNAILGFNDLLMEDERNSEKLDYMKIIRDSGKNLMNLINDILDLSRIEAGFIELVNNTMNLHTLFYNLHHMFLIQARDKGIELNFHINNSVPEFVIGDEIRIRQVVINIIGNAVKFTDEGSVAVIVKYYNQMLDIKIHDTGIGISPEKLEDIFTPFKQQDTSIERKYGGTGLGLAIALSLTKLMNGRISVESNVGRGSIFTVTLPLEESRIKERFKNIATVIRNYQPESRKIIESWIERKKNDKTLLPILYQGIRSLPDKINELQKAVVNHQIFDVQFISHELKGMAGNLGMTEVFKGVQKINDLSKKEKPVFEQIYFQTRELMEFVEHIPEEYLTHEHKHQIDLVDEDINFTVLLADDNEINRKLISLYLQELHIIPVMVKNGYEVLNALEKKQYDLLLLDLQMPKMDGREVLRRLKADERYNDLCIMIMSAHAIKEAADLNADYILNDYIMKPVDKRSFLNKIENCVIKKMKKQKINVVLDEYQKKDLKEIAGRLLKLANIFKPVPVLTLAEKLESFKTISSIAILQKRIFKAVNAFDSQALKVISEELLEMIDCE